MFSIRRIHDDLLPSNRAAIAGVRRIFLEHFEGAPLEDIDELGARLRNPFERRFRTILYVAENGRRQVLGFAILLHEPLIRFAYLDYIAARSKLPGRGIGAALYGRLREEAAGLGTHGLFFECLPDDPERCRDEEVRKQNAARLRFYEGFGAVPIVGTDYELPVPEASSADNLPHLMFDGLGDARPPGAGFVRRVVRAVLERKYGQLCPPEYVDRVVDSIHDPVRLREPRYKRRSPPSAVAIIGTRERIALSVNDKHDIHHVRERGYVESPVRIRAIVDELAAGGLTESIPVREYSLEHIHAVHDRDFVDYLEHACANAPEGRAVYPYVFPIRNRSRPPRELSVLAGYYCIDTFTPISRSVYPAARRGADCALSAADAILDGRRVAYALIRPPGHHAERRSFGGFCYLNNAAIAAHHLSRHGRVAILDIDYHHGNGQQNIFYRRADVLTVSLHGAPEFAYPYFTGFADERGEGPGEGFNLNLPLPEVVDGPRYRAELDGVLAVIRDFAPTFLVVALGLDPARGDPTGTWLLTGRDFEQNGRSIGGLRLPTLVIQEGGYRTRTLGGNARRFFAGLSAAALA